MNLANVPVFASFEFLSELESTIAVSTQASICASALEVSRSLFNASITRVIVSVIYGHSGLAKPFLHLSKRFVAFWRSKSSHSRSLL